MGKKTEDKNALDVKQSASAARLNRQSDRYGKSHILATRKAWSRARAGRLCLLAAQLWTWQRVEVTPRSGSPATDGK